MEDTSANFTKSINTYYTTHPSCLWTEPVKFPLQENLANSRERAPFDALVDQGILVRTNAEKNVLLVASQPANNYDLSDQGHSIWTPDLEQPDFGNFCYGHRRVTKIDSSTPTTDQSGATTNVVYRYTIQGVPAWAKAQSIQSAFHGLQADLTGTQVGRATLTDTRKGWQVTSAPWAHITDSYIYK